MDERANDTIPDTLGAFLRRQRELGAFTLNQFAATVGISNAYLSQIERGLRRPSETVLGSIARSLQLSADALESYTAPAREERSQVLDAIAGDRALSARQRSALGEMYRSFVQVNAQRRPRARQRARSTEAS